MNDNGSYQVEKSVEFYIPNEDTWVEVHRMLIVRYHHTMTEVEGSMTVAGGISYNNGETPAVEVFDGSLWTTSANMTTPRAGHTAVSIPIGSVLCKH